MPHRSANPTAERLQIRPIVHRSKFATALHCLGQYAGAPWVWAKLVDREGAEVVGNVELAGERAIMDVANKRGATPIRKLEDCQQAARVAGKHETTTLLYRESQQRIAARFDVRDLKDIVRMAVSPPDDLRHAEIYASRGRTVCLSERCIAVDGSVEERHDTPFEKARIV